MGAPYPTVPTDSSGKTALKLIEFRPETSEKRVSDKEAWQFYQTNAVGKIDETLIVPEVARVLGRVMTCMTGELRQFAVRDLGHEFPTLIITNQMRKSPAVLIQRYVRRMLIENNIADACLLDWREVNLPVGRIVRVPSKIRGRKNKPVIIPLHPALRAILEETPKAHRRGAVNPELAKLCKQDLGATVSKRIRDHLSKCGIDDVNTRKALKDRKKAGVSIGRLRAAPVASFHSLRHSFVSLLANANVPLATVRELVGHHSESIQRVYLHADPEAVRQAVATLPALSDTPALPEPAATVDALREEVAGLVKTADAGKLRALLAVLRQ